MEPVRLPSRAADRPLIRSIWVFLAPGRFAAKAPAYECRVSLDFLVRIYTYQWVGENELFCDVPETEKVNNFLEMPLSVFGETPAVYRVIVKAIPAAADSSTTSSGGARQTTSKTNPTAATAKSAGSRTALTQTGL
jgi:hypothetical protein